MKGFVLPSLLLVLCLFGTACSNRPTIELVQISADIVTDEGISGSVGVMDGEKEIGKMIPTILFYKFVLKNPTDKKIGDRQHPVTIKIEPSDELESVIIQSLGTNIIESETSKLGRGYQGHTELLPNSQSTYTISYDLGVAEKSRYFQGVPDLPPPEKLEQIREKRFSAMLVVMQGEEEIARFDLRAFANNP